MSNIVIVFLMESVTTYTTKHMETVIIESVNFYPYFYQDIKAELITLIENTDIELTEKDVEEIIFLKHKTDKIEEIEKLFKLYSLMNPDKTFFTITLSLGTYHRYKTYYSGGKSQTEIGQTYYADFDKDKLT